MHAVRQSMRPKHQVLILKCYPRYQKGSSEVKPNSSELSYLLYYASTRRSKISKVGAYLEEKTNADVPRGRLGNVQVTLAILRALMDKSPRDISLYAPYVLRILTTVLNSKDISMIEDTVPTFETFCEHQDHATLAADQELARMYDGVVKAYASFADKAPNTGRSITTTIANRWKSAGLKALKSISPTDTMAVDGGRQLTIIVPVLLKNLHSENESVLKSLQSKAVLEKDTPPRRRGSISTTRTSVQIERPVPVLSDTAAGADREATEAAASLALRSLKEIFSANNRAQIRLATSNVLSFLTKDVNSTRPGTATSANSSSRASWPISLIEMIANWTPVQDRFVIVVTAMERMIRYAPSEENLGKQLIIAKLVQHLLGSSINMIGLSVMDILLGLIQQILVVLQVTGKTMNALPVHHRMSAIDLFMEGSEESGTTEPATEVIEQSTEPSTTRQDLLQALESCMANLATHIYYGDQISDILTAILSRLKPSPSSGISSPVAAIEQPTATAQAIAESGNLREDSNTDEFFSFGTARVIALNAVKQVLTIANHRNTAMGAGAIGRNKVTVRVWEGTQWLLRDDDKRVRRAYVGALLTWLSLELNRKDLRIREDRITTKRTKPDVSPRTSHSVARAASTASRGERVKSLKTTFLQLLHLAVYDNILDAPEDNNDILLMHLLLVSLTDKLGVNALKSGLPMVLRLQEDINTHAACATPKAKVNIGSLVHGYLFGLSRFFEFETTLPGYEIGSEISRRRKAGLWLESVQIPPLSLDKIVAASIATSTIPEEVVKNESLKPFDHVQAMVNQIGIGYSNQLMAAPVSPPQSPGRGISTLSTSSILGHRADVDDELPTDFKEVLLTKWSKEACIAAIEKDAKSNSPHGSRSGTTGSAHNGFLSAKARSTRDQSLAHLDVQGDGRGIVGGLAIITAGKRHRSGSANGTGPPTPTSNIETRTLRMDDLKRVLAGHSMADAMSEYNRRSSSVRAGSPLRNSSLPQNVSNAQGSVRKQYRPSIISTGSDSIVDAEGFESASEGDPEHPLPAPQSPISPTEISNFQNMHIEPEAKDISRPPSRMSRPRSNSEASTDDPDANARALKGEMPPPVIARIFGKSEDVPPVPPLPAGLKDSSRNPTTLETPRTGPSAQQSDQSRQPRERSVGRNSLGNRRSLKPSLKQGNRVVSDAGSVTSDRRQLVSSLLNSIEVDDRDGDFGVGRPPY